MPGNDEVRPRGLSRRLSYSVLSIGEDVWRKVTSVHADVSLAVSLSRSLLTFYDACGSRGGGAP